MMEWLLDDVLPLAGFVLAIGVAFRLLLSLKDGSDKARHDLSLRVFCEHCAWEGRVTTARKACARCGSTNLLVVNC